MALSTEQESDFRRFVEVRWPTLVRTAYLLVGDHGKAEDLVQQTWVSVHRRWGSLDTGGSPMAYVRTALVNQAISNSRRRRVREALFGHPDRGEDGYPPGGFDRDPRDGYARVDNLDALLRGLRDLPPRMRAVIVLRYFEDLTEAATAEALGMSIGSVKSQTSRGLDRLRTLLSPTDNTEGSMR